MNLKTGVELQLEILRKLKEKQKNSPKKTLPRESASDPDKKNKLQFQQLRKVPQKRPVRGIPLSEEGWSSLRDKVLSTRKLRLNKALGNWAVELLVGMPPEMHHMSGEIKSEVFSKVRIWLESRGLK